MSYSYAVDLESDRVDVYKPVADKTFEVEFQFDDLNKIYLTQNTQLLRDISMGSSDDMLLNARKLDKSFLGGVSFVFLFILGTLCFSYLTDINTLKSVFISMLISGVVVSLFNLTNMIRYKYFLYQNSIGSENRGFYTYLSELFMDNYATKRGDVRNKEELAYAVATIFLQNDYINIDVATFKKSVMDRFRKDYNNKILLEEAIKESFMKLKNAQIFGAHIEDYFNDFQARKILDEEEIFESKKNVLLGK